MILALIVKKSRVSQLRKQTVNLKILFSIAEIDVCENYFKNIFFKENVIRKNLLLAGDFNVSLLYFYKLKRFKTYS